MPRWMHVQPSCHGLRAVNAALMFAVRIGALIVVLLGAGKVQRTDAQPLLPAAQEPQRYRMIYAPRGEIERMAEGEYRPVLRQEFSERVQALRGEFPEQLAQGVAITEASYAARLEGRRLLVGSVRWQVELLGAEARWFSLETPKLALSDVRWIDERSVPTVADLGSRPGGGCLLFVPQSGQLHARWSLAPVNVSDYELGYVLDLPSSGVTGLDLQIPREYELIPGAGVARRIELAEDPAAAEVNPTSLPAVDVWRWDLGGQHRAQLRLRRRDAPPPVVSLRQANRYAISEQGLELATDLQLDCDQQPVATLILDIDPSLRITKITHRNETIPWKITTDNPASHRVVLEFPQPLRGLGQTIRVTAIAPPGDYRSWELPRVRVRGDVSWLQEAARIRVAPPFRVQDLRLEQAIRLPSAGELPSTTPSIALQFQDPTYRVRLSLSDTTPPSEYRTATHVRVDLNEMLATVRVNVRSESAENFDVFATLQDGWNLESVESVSAELMDESPVLSSPTAPRQLRLRFREPLPTDRWTPLTIRLRRPVDWNQESVPMDVLQPLIFAGANANPRRFLSLETAAALEVTYPQTPELTWLSLDDLDAVEASLVSPQAGERLILLDAATETQWIGVRKRADATAVVSAKIEVQAEIDSRTMRQQFRIEIERLSGRLDQLHVELIPAHTAEIRWFFEGNTGRELVARRLPHPDSQRGEVWQIDWPELASDQAVLVGESSWPIGESTEVALARVREARSQEGTIVIEGPPELTVQLAAAPRFTPVLDAPATATQVGRRRYAYRYTPIFDEASRLSLQLEPTSNENPWLVVWRSNTAAQVDQAGTTRYDVTLWAENLGTDELQARLPADCSLRQVLVDGAEPSYETQPDGTFLIPLPLGQRFPCIELRFDHDGEPWTWWHTPEHREVLVSAPVLHRETQLWTPPDFRIAQLDLPTITQLGGHFLGGLRRVHERPFDFFEPASWQRLSQQWLGDPSELDPGTERLVRLLGQSEVRSVGMWLEAAAAMNVWVDYAKLSERGITPRTTLNELSGSDNLARGHARLRALRLGLIEAGDLLLITTEEGLSYPAGVMVNTASNWIVRYRPDRPQAAADGVPAEVRDGGSWMPAARWQAAQVSWRQAETNLAPYVVTGWRVNHLESAGLGHVLLYRRPHLTLLRCVAFVLGLAAAWSLARHRRRRGLLVTAVFASAAFALPTVLAVIAMSAAWGSLIGILLPLLQPPPMPTHTDRSTVASRLPREPASVASWLIGAALLSWISSLPAWGQQPSVPTAATERPTWKVFAPANERGEPDGKYLYVPVQLYRELWSNNPQPTAQENPPWTLVSATYSGVLEPSTDQSRLDLTTINADFELHVSRHQGVIMFPLAAEAATALRREAFWDGRPVQLQWDANRAALLLPIQQSGRHHLQVSFTTVSSFEARLAEVSFPIPATAQATLLLTSPQDLQPIEIPSAFGLIQRREATGQIRAELGPTDRLRITWPVTSAADPQPAIDQLSWLRLDRSALRLDLQFVVDTRRYLKSTLVIEADERLQLDVPRSDQPLSLAPANLGGARRLEFALTPTSGQAVVRMSFLMSGSTGVGTTVYPHLRVVDQPVTHWLGISAGGGLSLRVQPGNGAALAVNEYATRWGGAEAPDFAYAFDGEMRGWNCQTQQIRMTTQIELQSLFALGLHETTVVHLATVRADQANVFQLPLELDPGCELVTVQVLPESTGQRVRFEQTSETAGTLQFAEPISGPFQLGLVCRHANQPIGRRTLPKVRFPEASAETTSVDLYRRADALLPEVPTSPGLLDPELPSFSRNRLGLARWVARWDDPIDAEIWAVQVEPNARQLEATVTSTVRRSEGIWQLHLKIDMTLSQGVLDAIALEIPSAWTAWLQDDAAMRVVFAQASRPEMSRITVWPLSGPLDASQPIELSGPIPTSPGQPLTVPNIQLLEKGTIQQRVYLPQTVDGQPVLWNPRGLRPLGDEIPLPDAAQANGQEASDYRGYELVDDRFEAIRSPAKNAVGEPRVVLADVLVAAERSGQYLGLAMFDLIPEGLDSCSVEFPAGLEPVLITIDQQPQRLPVASPPSGDDEQPKDTSQSDMKRQRPNKQRRAANQQPETKRQRVDLWLLSSEQPQQIRVMFRGHAELSEQTGGQLQMPHLAIRNAAESDLAGKPISVDQTLWTIQMPQGLGQLTTWQIGGDPADWATQQRMRQSRLIAAADFVERKAVELAPRDLATWYSRWCDRLVASSRQTRVLAALDPAADWTASEELLEKTYREQTERAGRLQNEAIWQRATAQDQAIDMNGVWHRAVGLTRPTAYRAFEGSKEALPWKIASTPSPWPPRLLAMGLVLLTAVGLQRWPSSATWLSYRWPGLWGVLLGIGWWLFLQPSIFGWVIVGLSLLLTALLR